MQNLFEKYIQSISSKFTYEETSEMGYRKEFEILLEEIFEKINVRRIDHDPKAKQGNKPDFIVMKNDLPILYLEAKDIGVDLDKIEKSKQMERYFGYANLVLTDYVEFRFYRNGLRYQEPIRVANYDMDSRTLTALPENYNNVTQTLIDFTQSHKEPIKSGEHLAKIMGGKAQRLRDNIKDFQFKKSEMSTEITRVYEAIKKFLVHDLSEDAFADMYAQTLVYGLFVARYHDDTPESFSRQEARELIPKSNPLLRHFFDHIVGPNFDKGLEYIVNELCEVFAHANVQQLMKQYYQEDLWGEIHEGPDPVIHFYEDFLKEYDAELRKKMGAFYTPLPVVRFIIRSVDYLLNKEFNLPSGLADTSKLKNGRHRLQILDPAVGTGTFLNLLIQLTHKRLLDDNQKGRWPSYVFHDLLPRIHGFELMMAPYTIAHLKLSMTLKETGFKHFNQRRLGIYLTNSLEESELQDSLFTGFGFAESIAGESKEAAVIKNETPIMVVIGNPPYSVSSSNKGKWITNLIKDYKKNLNERNIQPLSDDYIKFIRFAEHYIEKNKTGMVAMITNNSFLDGIIHRQMRKHLLETFDEIYVLDLHGNAKKKETAQDGSKDENVFDIQQGVTIFIMIRKSNKKDKLGVVKFAELYGKRTEKFKFLNNKDVSSINWVEIENQSVEYFFVNKNYDKKTKFDSGFSVNELFIIGANGIKSERDVLTIQFNKDILVKIREDFISLEIEKIRNKYNLKKDGRDWKISTAKEDLKKNESLFTTIHYRPFDYRFTIYTGKSKGFHSYPRHNIHQHLIEKNNISLIIGRQGQAVGQMLWNLVFINDQLLDSNMFYRGGNMNYPLYTYSKDGTKAPNLKTKIVNEIEKIVGKVTPENILDYIYAVLHSPNYREEYKEFLKMDFPRVPYPNDKITFKKLVELGTELRQIHLLESPKVNKFITTYPVPGSNEVEKITYKDGKVFINKEQYFGKVPESALNFYIGGFQPAQKWLKDRKARTLTNQDIEHYQKIIVALSETNRIMKEIDLININILNEQRNIVGT